MTLRIFSYEKFKKLNSNPIVPGENPKGSRQGTCTKDTWTKTPGGGLNVRGGDGYSKGE